LHNALEDAVPTTIDLPNESVSLHDLVRRAVQGDEIIIAEAGTPLVRLVPITPPPQPQPRRAGLSDGTAIIADDFDAPLPDRFWLGEE
jgi:antitoxin (DNA-binding transcriptional repressor) of toxin-antitoxin stability system